MSEPSTTDSPFVAGLALVVGAPERRRHACQVIEARGATAVEVDDPYSAMSELCRSPAGFSTIVLSLHGIYREELQIIAAVRRRFPRVEVWLTDLDGRSAALVDAMRLGADGLLGEDGLHRLSNRAATVESAEVSTHRISPNRPEEPSSNGHAITRPEAVGEPARFDTITESTPSEPRRIGAASPSGTYQESPAAAAPPEDSDDPYSFSPGEPILTAEELRALLHDQPETERLTSDG